MRTLKKTKGQAENKVAILKNHGAKGWDKIPNNNLAQKVGKHKEEIAKTTSMLLQKPNCDRIRTKNWLIYG